MSVEFHLLGGVEVRVNGVSVPVGPPKQRTMLALLLVRANDVVTLEALTEEIWGESAPASALANLRTYATGLRRILPEGERFRLAFRPTGYRLEVAPGELDVDVFAGRVRAGRAALAAGDLPGGVRELDRALAMWRGRAGEDTQAGPRLAAAFAGLEEQRLTTMEDSFEARLGSGQAAELVAPLREVLAAHPLRERGWAQLMRALYQLGDVAGAGAAFAEARRALVEALGVEPGPDLQQLHHRILKRDPALSGEGQPDPGTTIRSPSAPAEHTAGRPGDRPRERPGDRPGERPGAEPTAPRELPPAPAVLVGRNAERALIADALAGGPRAERAEHSGPNREGRPVVVAIHGPGGVGKSALAVAAAHDAAKHFPDGQLYVDLQGSTPGLVPLTPGEVLPHFLRALGVPPARIPADPGEAGALLRTCLADRRVLVVADNAVDAAHVAPLLPAAPGCAVVVTSRQVLGTLDDAVQVPLAPLTGEQAATLLAVLVGADRARAEPEAVARVAHSCGNLPLALRIAGARLLSRPDWGFADLATRLADQTRTLHELSAGPDSLRSSLQVSWRELTGTGADAAALDPVNQLAAQAFLALGALQLPDVDRRLIAEVVHTSTGEAEMALDRLVDVRLVEAVGGRYRMHDLVRLFAAEATAREPETYLGIVHTALGWYLDRAVQVNRLLRRTVPGVEVARISRVAPAELDGIAQAAAWIDGEHANMVALVRQSISEPPPTNRMAADVVLALYPSLLRRSYAHDWETLCGLVIGAEDRLAAPSVIARALTYLAILYRSQSRLDDALACLRRGLAIHRETADRNGEAQTLETLGMVHVTLGEAERALSFFDAALTLRREAGDIRAEGVLMSNTAEAYYRLGQYDRSLDCLERSLAIRREVDDIAGEAITLLNLATVHHDLGRYAEAQRYADLALEKSRASGERETERRSHSIRAQVELNTGRVPAALADSEAAVRLAEAAGGSIDPSDLRDLITALRQAGHEEHAVHIGRRLAVLGLE